MPRRKKGSLEWAQTAEDDLEQIRKYIARDSPLSATRFIAGIKKEVGSLRTFPHMGEMLDRGDGEEIREIYVKSYRVLFRVRERAVRILAVIHGARDFEAFDQHLGME